MSTQTPIVQSWFHAPTFTATHCIIDPQTRHCAILDSVLDFDYASGRTRTDFADRIAAYVREQGLTVDWLLESHAHADHLSAAPYLKKLFGGRIAIGEHIQDVQKVFSQVFNDSTIPTDGSPFDHLFKDGETFAIGNLQGRVMHTPGHTPACVTYLVGDSAFVGDTLFMPDYGTARCDFPGGDAHVLYQSVQKLYSLPPETKLYLCHDYMPGGREPIWQTTVQAEREGNVQLNAQTTEEEFVAFRKKRDATLNMPALILPSVQVNVRAGEMPKPEANGVSYLKLPVNAL
ncbi:MAG: MBL fold metallo-hydrolase [Thiomonas sp.]|uniref:MBL fold metallo-hydrolase n=1 Tax=Thiomonas sp. TaxID=2047785 RepID=UPI002A366EC4|nr:MBL fold metallo-hydrolase [Thiomonas sp.]MDY0328921.1 MBL fold metallo-hydrolase [Thiomonas sp.]